MTQHALMAWSSGKDSALALHEVQQAGEPDVVALLTTVTEEYDRISMHGIRRELLEAQSASIDLPLAIVSIPRECSDEEYGARMRALLEEQKAQGVSSVIFGDLFLEDVRQYRVHSLAQVDMRPVFPLWRRDTAELARQFIDQGFRAITTCVDSERLDREFVGREFDAAFLADLPDGIDPCGEN
ncbi:MAG: ATP-binding protein, partial [Armatimonadota bacterium]